MTAMAVEPLSLKVITVTFIYSGYL